MEQRVPRTNWWTTWRGKEARRWKKENVKYSYTTSAEKRSRALSRVFFCPASWLLCYLCLSPRSGNFRCRTGSSLNHLQCCTLCLASSLIRRVTESFTSCTFNTLSAPFTSVGTSCLHSLRPYSHTSILRGLRGKERNTTLVSSRNL